jgi:Fur family ferric uptake transcriptional regulator
MAKIMKPKLDWESQIREKGLRATKAAVLVLKTLQQIKRPLSHDELLERLNQSSSIDTVTLYRVLDRFTQTSLIERMLGSDRVSRYRYPQGEHHEFFECDSCHQHFQLPRSSPLPILLDQVSRQLKSQASAEFAISFNLQGTCRSCKIIS